MRVACYITTTFYSSLLRRNLTSKRKFPTYMYSKMHIFAGNRKSKQCFFFNESDEFLFTYNDV